MQRNMLEAKSQLSTLVQAVLAGEDDVTADKVATQKFTRKPGAWSALPKADEIWDFNCTHSDLCTSR